MKPELFLLFALGVPSTSACAFYTHCHCYDSDGTPNNVATSDVCDLYRTPPSYPRLIYDTFEYGPNTEHKECEQTGAGEFYDCDWKDKCKKAGATGSDSSCWCKDCD